MNKQCEEFRKGYKVEEYKVEEYKANDKKKEQLYEQFISDQEKQFELYINYINEILIILKDYRIVSNFTKVQARIKAIESAISNDSKKALDDVFGIEVDFATSGEEYFVSEIIKGTLKFVKDKIHINTNGYKAYHVLGYPTSENVIIDVFEKVINKKINPEKEYENYYDRLSEKDKNKVESEKEKYLQYFYGLKENFELYAEATKDRMSDIHINNLKNDLKQAEKEYLEKQKEFFADEETSVEEEKTVIEKIPVVEYHLETIQVAIYANVGPARHDEYKGMTSTDMQKLYDAWGGKIPLSMVPRMYSSDLKRDDYGNIIPMQVRSSDKTLETMYPGLITMRHKRRQEHGER